MVVIVGELVGVIVLDGVGGVGCVGDWCGVGLVVVCGDV